MMNKLMTPITKIALWLMVLCMFCTFSCRKDLLQPNAKILENSISITEARQYFDSQLKEAKRPDKLMSASSVKSISAEDFINNKEPLWDYAYDQLYVGGKGIKIPIDFGEAYAEVSSTSKKLLPLASLNYLYMYKDKNQKIHAEWVLLKPDSSWLYGNRSSYSGQISIRDWNGKSIRHYNFRNGERVAKAGLLKQKQLSSLSKIQNTSDVEQISDGTNGDYYCIRVSYGDCPQLYPCSASYCDMCIERCAKRFCTFVPPDCMLCDDPPVETPPGEDDGAEQAAGGNDGGGGGSDPSNYPPSCNPDPNYTVPDYPAPEGQEWILPCSGPGVVPVPAEPVDTDAVEPDYDFNIPPGEMVWSDFDGRFISYSEVTAAIEANPDFVEAFDQEDIVGPGWPSVPLFWSNWGAEKFIDCMYEAAHLRVIHPNLNINIVMGVAMRNTYKGTFHFALDLAGMVPVIGEAADVTNGAIYFVEGDHLDAAMSFGAAIPVWGWVSTGGKWVKTAAKVSTRPIASVAGKVAYRAVHNSKRAVRFIKVAVGDFTHFALKSVKAVKPADRSLTNLSRTILEQMGHRIRPLSASIRSKVDDIILHADATGVKTEALCDEMFESGGFVKYDAKFGSNNGFDGVYIKKDAAGNVQEIIINEAKQVSAVGNIKLNAGNPQTLLNPQMSDGWISDGIHQLKNNSSTAALGNMLEPLFQNNRNLFTKTVTGVDRNTSEIIIIKLTSY